MTSDCGPWTRWHRHAVLSVFAPGAQQVSHRSRGRTHPQRSNDRCARSDLGSPAGSTRSPPFATQYASARDRGGQPRSPSLDSAASSSHGHTQGQVPGLTRFRRIAFGHRELDAPISFHPTYPPPPKAGSRGVTSTVLPEKQRALAHRRLGCTRDGLHVLRWRPRALRRHPNRESSSDTWAITAVLDHASRRRAWAGRPRCPFWWPPSFRDHFHITLCGYTQRRPLLSPHLSGACSRSQHLIRSASPPATTPSATG